MPEYQAACFSPADMPGGSRAAYSVEASPPIKAAIRYLSAMAAYSDVDDDPITKIYVYDTAVEPCHVYGYRVIENGATPDIKLELIP